MLQLQGEKCLWILPTVSDKEAIDIARVYNISVAVAQILLSRGITEKTDIENYLFTSIEKVPHTSLMKDSDKFVDRIAEAIEKKEKILIFGDYDVDGVTATAMMMLCLLALKLDINFFLPNRVRDGYGLSVDIVEKAAANGYKLIITVDNGITAFEAAAKAKELGVDLIITDHHRAKDTIPEAVAIIDPNQPGCTYPFKGLAGVGVAYKLLSFLYEKRGLEMPAKAYELLLLGTVGDIAPMTGENRYWVRRGLNYVNDIGSLAIKILKLNSRLVKNKIDAKDVGFCLTPQINALGRLEDPRCAIKFLIGSDITQIENIGGTLLELNQARKFIETSVLEEIEKRIESKQIDLQKEKAIVAYSTKWPVGVIGLAASRLVDRYRRPTFLFHVTKDGLAKGSCRSIPEFDVFEALGKIEGVLESFGGHSVAAGLSLKLENMENFKSELNRILDGVDFDPRRKINLDAELKLSDLSLRFIKDLEYLEPFGNSNEEPVFYLRDASLVQKPNLIKNAHVKCSVFSDGVIKPIIFFNRPELFEWFNEQQDSLFDLAVQVTENSWHAKNNIELIGVDVARKIK